MSSLSEAKRVAELVAQGVHLVPSEDLRNQMLYPQLDLAVLDGLTAARYLLAGDREISPES